MSSSEEYLDSLLASMSADGEEAKEAVVLDGSDSEQTFENAYIEDYFEEFQKRGIISDDSEKPGNINSESVQTNEIEDELADIDALMASLASDNPEAEEINILDDSVSEIAEESIIDIPEATEPELEAIAAISEEDEPIAEEEEALIEEMFMDMSEIDAILQDKSEVHPELYSEPEPISEEQALESVGDGLELDSELSELDSLLDMNSDNTLASDNLGIDAESLMGLDDVDAMLAAAADNSVGESEITADYSDDDLMEIQSLLQKSDQNEVVEDELLSMLDGFEDAEIDKKLLDNDSESEASVDEEEAPEDNSKKKNKKDKKNKKSKEEASSDDTKKEKKPGLFDKIKAFMFEDDEEDEETDASAKKDKKSKKGKKGKDSKASAGSEEDINAQIEAELAAEDKKKKKKEKKPKEPKPKKEKKIKAKKVEEPEKFSERSTISKGGIIATVLICIPLLVLIIIFAYFLPKQSNKLVARAAYYNGDYETAALDLYGEKLSKSDSLIYQKAMLLYKVEAHVDKYEAYQSMNKELEAINEIFKARKMTDKLAVDASTLDITDELDAKRDGIDYIISSKYGLDKDAITEICGMKPLYYTLALEDIVAGNGYSMEQKEAMPAEEQLEDPLEGEEELIYPEAGNESLESESPLKEIIITGEESPEELLEGLNQFEIVDPLPEE